MGRENLEQLISMYKTYIDLECEIKHLWFDKVSRDCQYFYHKELHFYGVIHLANSEIIDGEIYCTKYYVEEKYGIPTISHLKGYVDLTDFDDEIELLSKEDFVNGLKKELQNALDNM